MMEQYVNITFLVTRSGAGLRALPAPGEKAADVSPDRKMQITVPLLTIMPIPFIRIPHQSWPALPGW